MGFRNRDGEERLVYVERDTGGGSFQWFVVGAAIGAGLGLLFAPRSGARTRRALGRRLGNLKTQAEEQLDSLADGIEAGAERLRHGVDRWVGEDEDDAAGDEDGLELEGPELEDDEAPEMSAREELELRLQRARARRRKPAPADEEEEPVA
jgi:gas vesicle protein